MLAAGKTLAFRKKQPKAEQARDAAVVLQLSLVVRLLGRDGLWRTRPRKKPMPCRRAQQWPRSSLSCFELFRAPRGRRARGDARAAARGPHGCKERARARTPTERENALTRQPTQGSKAGGGGERADANSEFARKYNLDDKELGTGAFSRVILATSNEGTKVAVKCISKNGELKQEDVDSLHEEVAVLRSVDHPNIVKLYDFFDEKRYYYMAIELMEGGELFERIVKKTFYNEMDARGLVRILLDALAYLHHRGIVHRDLKPENL